MVRYRGFAAGTTTLSVESVRDEKCGLNATFEARTTIKMMEKEDCSL